MKESVIVWHSDGQFLQARSQFKSRLIHEYINAIFKVFKAAILIV